MEKYELEDSLKEEIRSRTLGEGFIKLVQSVRRGGGRFRISLRPVEIGGERKYQAEMAEGRDVQVKNFDANGAAEGVEEIIAQKGARELHLITATGDLHVRVTKKGHVLVSRSAGVEREATARNIMLKCEYGVKPGQPGPVGEYLELRDWWKVVPWLETRLAPLLEKHLSRYA